MDADCLVGTEFATRPQQKRHKSMTDGLSISVYYMGCLDQGPDRCFEPLKVSDKKNNNQKIFVRQNLQVSPDIIRYSISSCSIHTIIIVSYLCNHRGFLSTSSTAIGHENNVECIADKTEE
jgi:hypothetical protein